MTELVNKEGYTKELWDFRTHLTIHCPNCDKKTLLSNEAKNVFFNGKISCIFCGYCKVLGEGNSYYISTKDGVTVGYKTVMSDPKGIRLLLWYSENFKGNSLWAYNETHLQFLYDFILAKHRTRSQKDFKNKSLGSRLPKWMTSAANRDEIIKLIKSMYLSSSKK